MKAIDLTNRIFGNLKVIKYSHNDASNHKLWLCLCTCGNTKLYQTSTLMCGNAISCGCKYLEYTYGNKMGSKIYKHGMYKTRFYRTWRGIKYRCNNPNNCGYKYYGQRGIKIDKNWLKFENFYNDMYSSYIKHCNQFGENNTSIDRFPDKLGDYTPNNTRWATSVAQSNNMTTNRYLTYNNQTHTIREWEKILKFSRNVLSSRLNKYKWSVKKAMLTKPKCRKK